MRLFFLTVRREWSPLFAVFVCSLLIAATMAPEPEAASPLAGLFSDSAASHGALRRQAAWSVGLFLILPYFVIRAAGRARAWRATDADWFAALPSARARFSAVSITGPWLASTAFVAAAWLASEVPNGKGTGLRYTATLDNPSFLSLGGDEGASWTQVDLELSDLPSGSVLFLSPTITMGAGPTTSTRITLADGTGLSVSNEARLFGRRRLPLPVPAGARGPARFHIERLSPGATLALPRACLEVFVPAANARLLGPELFLRAALASLAWCALAAGLGAWMRPGLAATLALALAAIPHTTGTLSLWPGAGLIRAWEFAGEGVLAPVVSSGVLLVTFCVTVCGWWMLKLGLEQGRGEA